MARPEVEPRGIAPASESSEYQVGQRIAYRGSPHGPLTEGDLGTVTRITNRGTVVQFDHMDGGEGFNLMDWNLTAITKPRKPRKRRRISDKAKA